MSRGPSLSRRKVALTANTPQTARSSRTFGTEFFRTKRFGSCSFSHAEETTASPRFVELDAIVSFGAKPFVVPLV